MVGMMDHQSLLSSSDIQVFLSPSFVRFGHLGLRSNKKSEVLEELGSERSCRLQDKISLIVLSNWLRIY